MGAASQGGSRHRERQDLTSANDCPASVSNKTTSPSDGSLCHNVTFHSPFVFILREGLSLVSKIYFKRVTYMYFLRNGPFFWSK